MARETFYLMCRLKKTIDFSNANVLQLGRQSGIVSYRQIKHISKEFGLEIAFNNKNDYNFYRNYPTGDEIFKLLGFKSVKSLDSNNFEGASFVYDLNTPINNNIFGEYDLVYDGGTSEHIFDQLAVLDNVFKLLKVGGIVVHHTPANNFIDHGYHQPSPSFYYEYYMSNGYELIDSYLIQTPFDFYRKRRVYPYEPLMYERLSYGGWGNKMVLNWFVFRKLATSTSKVIPQQQRYTKYFHVYNRPPKSTNTLYGYIVKQIDRHPAIKFYILQSKHWSLKILKILKYLNKQKPPKPIFRA
jgi:SAM-dependent methyltransferase